ncbi:DNA-directed RNA polymerase subunit E'' [Candidatus Woesearchaeota archaeon]|nr:DNA-directed RNA polymerase subunit E'' [Candidatus Woesearchaeota archaeon]
MKKKACKNCKIFVEGDECPLCKGSNFTTTWKGRLFILDAKKSQIAEKISAKVKGEYAIKTR